MSTRRRYFIEVQVRTDHPDDETDRAVELFADRIKGTTLERVDGREMAAEIRTTRVRDYDEMAQYFKEEDEDEHDPTIWVPSREQVNAHPMTSNIQAIADNLFIQGVCPDDDLQTIARTAAECIYAAKVLIMVQARMSAARK